VTRPVAASHDQTTAQMSDDTSAPSPPPVPAFAAKRHSARDQLHAVIPRTLTGRLVAGVVGLVLLLVFTIGIATYTALRPFLTDRLDQQLSSVATSENLTRYLDYARQPNHPLPGVQDVWFTVLSEQGDVIVSVPDDLLIHPLNLSSAVHKELILTVNKPHTVTTTDGTELRLLAVRVTFRGSDLHAVAVVGLSTQDVHDTLHRLVLLELIIGATAVAFAAGITTWGVRRGLRPLHRVTRTAQEVTAELGPDGAGLDRRVPDADPTTEFGQVASSVNTLLGAVETEFAARLRSEDRMRQFLADASHELRTPLTSIRGYAELSRLQGQSSGTADDAMRRIEIEGTRMSRLVEDLLVLARGDQGAITHDEVIDIDALLAEAATAAKASHPEREIDLIKSNGAAVIGDRYQLLRVLLNLLNNAAVHTASGPIRVEGIQGQTSAGWAVALRVTDTGPGLSPDDARHVFERFWRADKARSRAKGGSGLGMAIVAQIVEGHSGTVTFDSSVEHGTTVTVTLPMQPPRGRQDVRSVAGE